MNLLRKILYKLCHTVVPIDRVDRLVKEGLVIGTNFHMHNEVIIDPSHLWHIEIGDDVTLAPRVHLLAHDASTKIHLGYTRIGKIKIGNRVFVGTGTIVMPGVTIGDDVIVGASSIVTRDVPKETVVAGNPAKVICSLKDYLDRKQNEMEKVPCFGEEYTVSKGVTPELKKMMNDKMKDGFGYIV